MQCEAIVVARQFGIFARKNFLGLELIVKRKEQNLIILNMCHIYMKHNANKIHAIQYA
jgi:hypothetical protein